jgi:predicted O-methyltransferase YrrM
MDELRAYLKKQKVLIIEGSSSKAEQKYLASLAAPKSVKLIFEIGFNAGFSSVNFLLANPRAEVYSFDTGHHECVQPAKKYIDRHFPGRHHLILGDSRRTVPAFAGENPDLKFDLIFVDGGHMYKVALADLENCRQLARPDTPVVMDDLTPWLPYGIGPALAWRKMIRRGHIVQSEIFKDGRAVKRVRPPGKRAWAKGYYALDTESLSARA